MRCETALKSTGNAEFDSTPRYWRMCFRDCKVSSIQRLISPTSSTTLKRWWILYCVRSGQVDAELATGLLELDYIQQELETKNCGCCNRRNER
jgi:hypothetical protein